MLTLGAGLADADGPVVGPGLVVGAGLVVAVAVGVGVGDGVVFVAVVSVTDAELVASV